VNVDDVITLAIETGIEDYADILPRQPSNKPNPKSCHWLILPKGELLGMIPLACAALEKEPANFWGIGA
jgi:hypothetical protein